METAKIGRFWAVGVGPGDPELLTLKALRVLTRVRIVYHAGREPRRGRAWSIVEPHLRDDQEGRIVLTEAMSDVGGADWREHYRAAVERIAADCRQGLDVAFITEGDPTIYSTAVPIWQLLAEEHPDIAQEIVPGVTSITAAAARVGWPLARHDEPLVIVPAHYHAEKLGSLIAAFPTVCLLKPTRVLETLDGAVREFGPEREAVYLENVSETREFITHDLSEAMGRGSYFSLVLIRARAEVESKAGKLWIVGLGPGDLRQMTQRAVEVLHRVEVIVGYEAYLLSLASLHLRAEMRGSPIGAESARANEALELARAGRRIALVSSGDAGIYGMASLVLETAGASRDVEIEVVPGLTAATSAASLLGAPLGHDFTCISLSDLLTPWDVIETRLEAAARGDFVVALYNPISQRRTWQLPRAREILLRHRPAETPVGVVIRAYRSSGETRMTTLAELSTDAMGMETILIIGNRQTRTYAGRMVTPRGYLPATGDTQASGESNPRPVNAAGQRIMDESFAIIERELGPLDLPAWAFAVVRRMIHASADFEFARILRYSVDFEAAMQSALRDRVPVVTDTEMVLHGIRPMLSRLPGVTVACHLNDPETAALAEAVGLTRSAAGMRIAAKYHPHPLVVIGNAPTALEEALRLIEEEGWRPAAIIGMPVGFVGVVEAKERLLGQARVPYLTCVGRKGGSGVAAAGVNAFIGLLLPGNR